MAGQRRKRVQSRRSEVERREFSRVHARTEWMGMATKFAFVLVVLGICLVVIATNVPQYRKLSQMEDELEEVRQQERETYVLKQKAENERMAIRDDPEFLEVQARDRLDLAQPGETVIRIERE